MSADAAGDRVTPSQGGVRIDHTTTSGTFSLDGGTWEVENNVWVVGDDTECVVIDAPHDAGPILELVGDRRLTHVLLTHAHDDHVTVVPELLAAHPGATVALHPDDRVLWDQTHPDVPPTQDLADGDVVQVGDVELLVLHTPGHAPGACCFHARDLGVVFTGDMAGNFLALDSASGKVLYTMPTGGAIAGGVITYSVGDRQYVATTSGNISRTSQSFSPLSLGTPSIIILAVQ